MTMLKTIRTRSLACALALAIGLVTGGLEWMAWLWLGNRTPLFLFLPVILLVALAMGRVPGAIVLCMGAVSLALLSPPIGLLSMDLDQDAIVLGLYLLVGSALTLIGGELRLSTVRATTAEQRLRLAQENTGIGVFELDFRSETAYVSASLCKLLEQPIMAGPIALSDWLSRLGPAHVQDSQSSIASRFERGDLKYEREQRIELPSGTVLWLLSRVTLIVDSEGALIRAVGATIDISDRKRLDEQLLLAQAELEAQRAREAERLQAADRRKDEFLATLAHELRNPLAPIRQAVMVAYASQTDPGKLRWSLDIIERQVRRMALLLDDLLDVARISHGHLQIRRSLLSLSSVLDAALETSRPLIDSKQHRVQCDAPDAPVWIEVDGLRITQVLSNLINNAAKYTDRQGLIKLRASIENEDLILVVEDNGIGLSAAQVDRVFEMFSQAPEGLSRSEGGLGIGLSLSRGIVELHGGVIRATSPGIGSGSTFTVVLPAAVRTEHPTTAPLGLRRPAPEALPSSRCRLLVADDNVDAADSLAELLRHRGHEVHVAYNGEQALTSFIEAKPSVAILDIGMPGMTGLEVAQAIRQEPAGREAMLVALSGWGQDGDRQAALHAGFNHHATKPLDPVQIEDLIASHQTNAANVI